MADDNDDVPQLSAAALAALGQFYAEENEVKEQFERMQQSAEEKFSQGMKAFKEDWQLSQFWVRRRRIPPCFSLLPFTSFSSTEDRWLSPASRTMHFFFHALFSMTRRRARRWPLRSSPSVRPQTRSRALAAQRHTPRSRLVPLHFGF